MLDVWSSSWSILLSWNVMFPVSLHYLSINSQVKWIEMKLTKFIRMLFLVRGPTAITVDHAGNGNIHRIHRCKITSHWLATQNHNSLLDLDHRMHHLPSTILTFHRITTVKVAFFYAVFKNQIHLSFLNIIYDYYLIILIVLINIIIIIVINYFFFCFKSSFKWSYLFFDHTESCSVIKLTATCLFFHFFF